MLFEAWEAQSLPKSLPVGAAGATCFNKNFVGVNGSSVTMTMRGRVDRIFPFLIRHVL